MGRRAEQQPHIAERPKRAARRKQGCLGGIVRARLRGPRRRPAPGPANHIAQRAERLPQSREKSPGGSGHRVHHQASRFQHSLALPQALCQVGHVLQHVGREYAVERPVLEGQPPRRHALDVKSQWMPRVRVNGRNGESPARQQRGRCAVTRSEIQDAVTTSQLENRKNGLQFALSNFLAPGVLATNVPKPRAGAGGAGPAPSAQHR